MGITSRCAIEDCQIVVPRWSILCPQHWRLVPRPVQQEIYSLGRTRRGGPSHRAAVSRAISLVRERVDRRAAIRLQDTQDRPSYLPYRDD